jgi:CPA2 family monovalent cation:H+ antiporter-2
MALGAFVAGLLLVETEYRKSVEATIEPFKGLLLGVFFFSVGMDIDVRELLREPGWLLAAVLGLIWLKAVVVIGLGRLFRLSWAASLEAAVLLGPGGEFAFVVLGVAGAAGLVAERLSSFTLAVVSITMAATPLLSILARRIAVLIASPRVLDPELAARPSGEERHAIVVGFGRVGKVVAALLERHGVSYVAVDRDAAGVGRDRRQGHKVYYGDAADPAFLRVLGLMNATGVIITIDVPETIDEIVTHVRELRPDVVIVARARDAEHASHLYAIGATDAVPETIEASLQLSEAALIGLGAATGPVIASIHEKRDEFRHALQAAAKAAGREEIRAVRPKTYRLP